MELLFTLFFALTIVAIVFSLLDNAGIDQVGFGLGSLRVRLLGYVAYDLRHQKGVSKLFK